MIEHTCEWLVERNNRGRLDDPCGAVAHFKIDLGQRNDIPWWLCAKHYDQYVASKTFEKTRVESDL